MGRRRREATARRTRLPRTALIASATILVGVGVGLLLAPTTQPTRGAVAAPGHQRPDAGPATDQSRQLAALPTPGKAFHVPRAHQLHDPTDVTRWAPVKTATYAHTHPSASSPVVVGVSTTTPEGTANLVVVDKEATTGGVTWVHARLAVLPNDQTGWLPRAALGGWQFVDTHAVVNRETLTLTLYRGAKAIFRTPVGVGKTSTPTPTGRFYVRDKLTSYASPEYGPLAFGTSARSPFETDWPAGGFIGIHGTDEPALIPGHISHGCIRLRNAAIRELGRLMPVGTPVTIR